MTLVAVPRSSSACGGDLATSAAARRYLMASVSYQDDDGVGSVACGDDESCIFPSTASLAGSSVVAGSSASPYLSRRSPVSSPRRRSYSGPYVSEGSPGVAEGSFDSEESVCSTSTVGMSSFGYSPSPAYPSPCRSHRRRVLNDDVASDLTGRSALIAVPSLAESRNDSPVRATNPEKEGGDEKKKKGRGRGAMKSLSRSLRSRSPLLRSKEEVLDEKVKDVVDPKKDPKTPSSGRRRSRTRSPLRVVADSIKKSRRKQHRRSSSVGASLSKTLDPQEEEEDAEVSAEAGRGVRLMRSLSRSRLSRTSVVDPSDDGTASVYTTSSAGSNSAASAQRRLSTRSVVSSVVSVTSSVAEHSERHSRLPSLIREEEPVNEERTAQQQQPAAEVLESIKRRSSLIDKVRSHRRSRSREPEKSPSSGSSDVSEAIARIERRISESKNRAATAAAPPKVLRVKMSSSAPPLTAPKVLRVKMSPSAPPLAGLSGRMSTGQMMARLRAGSCAADAVRRLREHQAGLTIRKFSERRPGGKLSYARISGVAVPDYASYVEGAVGALRRTLGVSDEEYEVLRVELLGWAYYGSEI